MPPLGGPRLLKLSREHFLVVGDAYTDVGRPCRLHTERPFIVRSEPGPSCCEAGVLMNNVIFSLHFLLAYLQIVSSKILLTCVFE